MNKVKLHARPKPTGVSDSEITLKGNTVLDAEVLTVQPTAVPATAIKKDAFTAEGFEALRDWGSTPEPAPIEFVVDNMFPGDANTYIAGEGGVGKTWLAADLAVSVATGEDFLQRSTRKGPVLIINFDDTESLPRRFAERTACARGYAFKGLPISYWEPDSSKPHPKAGLFDSEVYEKLSSLTKHHKPRLIIIDSFVSALPLVNGNLAHAVVDAHEKLRAMRSLSPGCCLVILDHTPKSKKGGASGSMQKGARVRAGHVVTRIGSDKVGGDDMLRWHFHKINGAPPQRDFAILREQDETTARLTACDLPEQGNAPKAERVLETALRLVQTAGDDGIARTDLIKEVIAVTQIGKRTIEEVVNVEVRPHPNVLEYAIPGRGNPKGYRWQDPPDEDEVVQPDKPAQMEAAPKGNWNGKGDWYSIGLQFFCPECVAEAAAGVPKRRRRRAAEAGLRTMIWCVGTEDYNFQPAPQCKKHRRPWVMNGELCDPMGAGYPPPKEEIVALEQAKLHYGQA